MIEPSLIALSNSFFSSEHCLQSHLILFSVFLKQEMQIWLLQIEKIFVEITFTNSPGLSLSIVGSTANSPLGDCTPLGLVPEVSPGHYKFTDSSGFARRLFRVGQP